MVLRLSLTSVTHSLFFCEMGTVTPHRAVVRLQRKYNNNLKLLFIEHVITGPCSDYFPYAGLFISHTLFRE